MEKLSDRGNLANLRLDTDGLKTAPAGQARRYKPVLSPTNQSFFRPQKCCDIIKKI